MLFRSKISRFNPDDSPVVSVAVSSREKSLRDLTTLADQVIKKRLENVNGVGQATLVGGVKREIKVYLNTDALDSHRVGADQVIRALQSENQELPAGSVVATGQEKIVQIRARMGTPEDIANVAVFLASEKSSFMTGQTVHPNGGLFMAT